MLRAMVLLSMSGAPALAQSVFPVAMPPVLPLLGGFEKAPIPADSMYAEGIAMGDIDGDGRRDLLVGTLLSSGTAAYGFRYYRNRGDGTFEDRSHTHTAGGPAGIGMYKFALADLDGDGDLDVAGPLAVLRNQQGRLVQEFLPTTTSNRTCVAAGDVDGDGDVDLYVGVSFGGGPPRQDRVMLNNGSGVFTFAPASVLPVDDDDTLDVQLFDADGDGDLDAVVGIDQVSATSGGARLLRNNGAGVFVDASATFPVALEKVNAVAHADFDLDGDQDVVLGTGANLSGVALPDRFLRNTGGQFVPDASALPAVLSPTHDVVAADLDGDGDADLLLAEGSSRFARPRCYRNDGITFTDVSTSWLPDEELQAGYWATGDLDGDSRPEAALVTGVLSSARQGRVRLYRNRGGTSLQLLNPSRLPGKDWSQLLPSPDAQFVDYDSDGDRDLYVPASGSAHLLFRNDGFGRFVDASASLPAMPNATATAFADVDGDGDLDLLAATTSGITQWRNGGGGTFTAAPPNAMPPNVFGVVNLTVGDVDNDGDLDVFGGRQTPNPVEELLRNDGSGVFARDTTALPTHSSSLACKGCVMLDDDGDGDQDLVLVLGLGSAGSLSLYRNNGLGQFTATTGIVPALSSLSRLVKADLDGDGDQDLVVRTFSSTTFVRDVGATFSTSPPAGLTSILQNGRMLGVVDIEGDGDPDVIIDESAMRRVLRNDGAWVFTVMAGQALDGTVGDYLPGADLDGDLDADFFVTGAFREPCLQPGRRVQACAPWLPRVGGPYDIELHYQPEQVGKAASALFLWNTQRLPVPLPIPPLGTLIVDPIGAVFGFGVPPVWLDTVASFGFRSVNVLPGTPSLLGATIYSQALLATDRGAWLTNLVIDTVS